MVMDKNGGRFEKVYFNLPEAEKKLVIVIIDDRKITWEEAYKEIKQGTDLGKSIVDKLISQEII